MALAKFTGFTFSHAAQEDTPNLNPEQVKAAFDSRTAELKTFLDSLIDILNSTTDGLSGADNIAATAIADLDGGTLQALLESLRNKLKATADGASGADFVAATAIAGLDGETVQALLEALTSALGTHKSSSDHDGRYYTEIETDTTFATKQELVDAVLGAVPDGSLQTAKLADGAVTAAKVAADVATQAELDAIAGTDHTTETVKGNADALAAHLAEKATDEDLGHVKVDGETIIATNGVITAQTQIIDTVTEDKWEWGMEDGVVFLEKVVS